MTEAGNLAKISAVLGIILFSIADLFSILFFQTILSDPVDWEQGLAKIITIIFVIVYVVIFSALGSIFVLLGQIHRQNRVIVLLSTLTLIPIVAAYLYLSFQSLSSGFNSITEFLILWGVILVVIIQHVRGWQFS